MGLATRKVRMEKGRERRETETRDGATQVRHPQTNHERVASVPYEHSQGFQGQIGVKNWRTNEYCILSGYLILVLLEGGFVDYL